MMSAGLILIVEDSPFLAETISDVVQNMGYEPNIVASGEQALSALEAQVPDLILLDWLLPDLDGIEILRRIRAGPLAAVPVIMLTAKGELDARLEGLEAGADDYIPKPVHMRELQARIAAVLRRKDS